ncbi:MAG: ribosome recycling factor [Opitutales bacterium]|nr:ribosome recycling factor [Opitutales bacterium]MCH8540591.1 ribosome recycling factor [Opitutales bacterium]
MQDHPALKEAKKAMQAAVEHALHEFSTLHTGKASPSMVENLTIEAYGSTMRLKEVAAITTPDSRTIQIQPWDKSVMQDVAKAIQTSNLGINPAVDSNVIRLPMPDLSRERRQDLIKVCHGMAEDGRVSIRHARRDALDIVKAEQKDGALPEDDAKRVEKEIQEATDKAIKEIESHLADKEKELLTV